MRAKQFGFRRPDHWAWLVTLAIACASLARAEPVLHNDCCWIELEPGGGVRVGLIGDGRAVGFDPRFLVLETTNDPDLRPSGDAEDGVTYSNPGWIGLSGSRTRDAFAAAPSRELEPPEVAVVGRSVVWRIPGAGPEDPDTLVASVTLPEGDELPRLDLRYRVETAGYASLIYTGAETHDPGSAQEIYLPFIYTEKRFPVEPVLAPAFRCPLPVTMLQRADGLTYGVLFDPAELPFQPLPTFDNSRFGLLLRDADGSARPMAAKPVLGGEGSQIAAGDEITMSLRLVVHDGPPTDVFETLARDVYSFRDHRENLEISTNGAIDNIVGFALGPYSGWRDDLLGTSFETDVPDGAKNSAIAHPLASAIVLDDPAVWELRALPIWAYLLSRKDLTFVLDPGAGPFEDVNLLDGPAGRPTDHAAASWLTSGFDWVNAEYASQMVGLSGAGAPDLGAPSKSYEWQTRMAFYELTGDSLFLSSAAARAARYVEERVDLPASDWDDEFSRGMFFFTQLAPHWIDLLRLYELTGEQDWLDAAHAAARRFAMFCWLAPVIPDDDVLVNEGGVAPHYVFLASKGFPQMPAPEETVPAWRVSEIGLVPEGTSTSGGHRGIFLPYFAPAMLRLAAYTGDDFLRDIARSAVVGRCTNFPGYHMNTARTTVYLKPDYPLRPFEQLSYNSMFYNHVWPHAWQLMDWLYTQAWARSHGAIDFQATQSWNTAYFFVRSFGASPGSWFGDTGVVPWLPVGLADTGDSQIDYAAARGNGAIYLALLNQSPDAVATTVTLDAAVAQLSLGQTYPVELRDPSRALLPPTTLVDGAFAATIPAKGLVSAKITTGGASPALQHLVGAGTPLGPASYDAAGAARAMVIGLGEGAASAYVWLNATNADVSTLDLRVSIDGGPQQVFTKTGYPYEFLVPLPTGAQSVALTLEGTEADGDPFTSTLNLNAGGGP